MRWALLNEAPVQEEPARWAGGVYRGPRGPSSTASLAAVPATLLALADDLID
jgi:hypothetical protein